MIKENFIKLYEHSFRENWELPCYTDYGENNSYTYGEVAQEIARLHLLFKHCQLRRGDKIAIIGKNNARWCIAYMATITYGGIVVTTDATGTFNLNVSDPKRPVISFYGGTYSLHNEGLDRKSVV